MLMVDSTACIDFLNGNRTIKKKLEESDRFLVISPISIYEINIGLERTKRKKSLTRYHELNTNWLEFLSSIQILPLTAHITERAAQIYDILESKGFQIDDNDILIASTMLSNGIKQIVTRNNTHFEKIEGIEIIGY
jgi:predicted nucleic acid-binding protein